MPILQVPVTIEPEAQHLIDELGIQKEMGEILERLPEFYPTVTRVEMRYDPKDDYNFASSVLLDVWVARGAPVPNDWNQRWIHWFVDAFPVEVTTRVIAGWGFESGASS